MTTDFRDFAKEVARRNSVEPMLPVVEKELIHYEIMRALDQSKWLDRLNFQGGTCLRLCYGGARYSEDLDFTVQGALSDTDLNGFRELVSRSLEKKFDVSVRIKEPKAIKVFEGGGLMKRWQVVVNTAPARPDLPSQKIKIEIAQVPSYTREMRLLAENYTEIEGMYARTVVGCESLDEILADKLVSFSQSVKAVRYRDLWDIPWIAAQPGRNMTAVSTMVMRKYRDYHASSSVDVLLKEGARRARELTLSSDFALTMGRFISSSVMAQTVEREEYREAMAQKTAEIYELVRTSA